MYKMTRYIIFGIIICMIMQMSTDKKISARSLLLTAVAIVLACVFLESVFDLFKKDEDIQSKCSSVCAVQQNEHFNADNDGQVIDGQVFDGDEQFDDPIIDGDNDNQNVDGENASEENASEEDESLDKEENKFAYAEMVNSVNDGNKLNVNETDMPFSTDDGQNFNGLNEGINYANYKDYNHIPVPKDYISSYDDYGYSFLPPEKWYPQPPNPPVCISDKVCPVCPGLTTGSNMELKQWDNARNIIQPDHINVKYIKQNLNKTNKK